MVLLAGIFLYREGGVLESHHIAGRSPVATGAERRDGRAHEAAGRRAVPAAEPRLTRSLLGAGPDGLSGLR